MDAQIAPETKKIVSCQPSSQRGKKKVDFGYFFVVVFYIFFIYFCAVLAVGFEDISNILAKRPYQNQTGKPMVLRVK